MTNTLEHVVLVDEHDQTLGTEQKLKAHELGLLHRAFSVFVYQKNALPQTKALAHIEILLQQRHSDKYHCGGLWTNTCCSHPRLGETVLDAANRRLKEEMGITISLKALGTFQYKAAFENGLTEHELDHVFLGEWDNTQRVLPHPEEVMAYRFVSVPDLIEALRLHPTQYTPWLAPALRLVQEDLWRNF